MKRPSHIRLRTVVNAVGVAAFVAALTATLWLFGLQWLRALALALPITAVVVLARTFATNSLNSLGWPEPPVPGEACAGWHHVALLSSAIHEATGDPERFRSIIAPRLRKLAEVRLREHNLRWDDPPARDRLGRDVYELLTWPPDRPPGMARIRDAISAIEALGAPTEPTAAVSAAPSLTTSGAAQ